MASDRREHALLDEIEQLRTALEASDETLHRLVEDRERLTARLIAQSREFKELHDTRALNPQTRAEDTGSRQPSDSEALAQQVSEEELRVAFEEMQVLSEELEIANQSLRSANQELDGEVERRTRELKASEASFRAVANLVPDLLWRTDRAGSVVWRNKRWRDYAGGEEAEGPLDWASLVHPADRPSSLAAWRVALAGGETFHVEQRMRAADGAYRWFLARAEPVRNEHGDVTQWFGACTDIHDRRVAMEALQDTEQRLRTLIEGMPQLVWRAKAGGRWTWSSTQWRTYTGQSTEASLGMGWLNAIHPDDRDRFREAWTDVGEVEPLDIESRIFSVAEGRHRHFRTRATPVVGSAGRSLEWIGTSTDVDDTAALQTEQRVLVAELQHRTRNLIAVIRAVAERTIGSSGDLETFATKFSARLAALGRVQGLLSRLGENDRIAFDELLRSELSAHGAIDGPTVTLRGPQGVRLRSGAVQTLALALHELATNAVKYGALRQADAHLNVAWSVEAGPKGSRRLKIDWRESGVTMTDAALVVSGQGRDLIEKVLPYQLDARTTYVLGEDGVSATIDVPLSPAATHPQIRPADGLVPAA